MRLPLPTSKPFIPQYQTVYDSYDSKPALAAAKVDSDMMGGLIQDGVWDKLDGFWVLANHAEGLDSLRNWKMPAGGDSLLDPGKGNFDIDTESVIAAGSNDMVWESGAVKITHVNHTVGFYIFFQGSDDLISNLTVGKTYKSRIRAKCSNAIRDITLWTGTAWATVTGDLDTTYSWLECIFVAGHASNAYWRMNYITGGEQLWIDQWEFQEWTNAEIGGGAPTHDPYGGYLGAGNPDYIDLNWNPYVNGVNYQLDSASFGVYITTDIAANATHGIQGTGTENLRLTPRYPGDIAYGQINDASNIFTSGTVTDGSGMYILTRTASNAKALYRNGLPIASGTHASVALPNYNIYILGANSDGSPSYYRADNVSMSFVGSGLTQADVNSITNRFETRMDYHGKGVIS